MNKGRVLLTGHRGYVGVILTELLVENGYDVVGLDTNYYDGCAFVNVQSPVLKEIKKDIREISKDDLVGIDYVVHLAGLSNDPLGALNSELTNEINFSATINFAELAKSLGIKRFIYPSSCSVYGIAGEDFVDENSFTNPQTEYALSKLKSEKVLKTMADEKFCPVILRPGTAYGFSPFLRGDLVVNNLVGYAFLTKKIKIMSNGEPWRPLIHVKDFSRGFLACLQAPTDLVFNQVFNLGVTEENYKVKDIANLIKEIFPDCEIEYTGENSEDRRSFRVNFKKIKNVLADYFKPTCSLPMGIKELYEAYEKFDLKQEELLGSKYSHIKQIKLLIDNGKLSKDLFWVK